MPRNRINLTSSEIASLWTGYMNNSMAKCVLNYFLNHVEDPDIQPVIQYAYDLALTKLEGINEIFQEEQFAIPNGFTDADVNLNAPFLYTDTFCLAYIHQMAQVGMLAISGFIAMSAREDVREFFTQSFVGTNKLFHQSIETLLAKGLFVRAPYISVPKKTDYIDDKNYLSGFNLFSKQRPINAIEISHLHANIQTNLLGSKLALSFAQTSAMEEVQQFMLRGKEIAQKHIKVFSSSLLDGNIQAPMSSDIGITDSTTPVFSDKLMMFHMSLLSAAGAGNYATAAVASQRNDLILNYVRFSMEIAQFAKSGADIMIKNNWLEQPPGTINKEKLTKEKEQN